MPEIKKLLVIGLGRVGLPLSLVFADKGFEVKGIDVDIKRLGMIWMNKMPFFEEGAQPLLDKYGGNKFVALTEDLMGEAISNSDAIVITLGTPIDSNFTPNFSQIGNFFDKALNYLKKGQLIILRSTISPGVTMHVKRFIEEKSKFIVGKDIFLAYCPERIAEGKAVEELNTIPQIIGTFDKESAEMASEVFSKITEKIHFSNPLSSELAKLYCNIYRYIDFAIGNEFMMIAEEQGADIYEVLRLANEGYKRNGIKSPGFTAGPCLVKDSFFLLDKSPYLELMTAAWRINENVPGFVLHKAKERVGNLIGKKVAILGLAFKKNIDDPRYSLTPKLHNHFLGEGSEVKIHDPFIESSSLEETLTDADIVVIAVDHDVFRKFDLDEIRKFAKPDCLICDIWNIYKVGRIFYPLNDILENGISKAPQKHINGDGKRQTRIREGGKEQWAKRAKY